MDKVKQIFKTCQVFTDKKLLFAYHHNSTASENNNQFEFHFIDVWNKSGELNGQVP